MMLAFKEGGDKPPIQIGIVRATPLLTLEQMEAMTKNVEAIVIITFATGTVPDRLGPIVQAKVEAGVPVFLVSNNPGDDVGILRDKYLPQANFRDAGAIRIESVNINRIEEVFAAIQEEAAKGKRGGQLGAAVEQRFLREEPQ